MDKHLHIVTHEVPWPVKHGGLIDLFYKIVALHKQGVMIHLHCFTKNKTPQPELNKYCASVNYYNRKTGISGLSLKLPYIVYSRRSDELTETIKKDDHPILLEGIHCTWMLHSGSLTGRKVFVRLHNVEYIYYGQLARLERNPIKKLYFKNESRSLKKYEQDIARKAVFLAVSKQDALIYKKLLHATEIHFLPVFIPYQTVAGHPGNGNYCLYHGNLSVNENEQVAEWLVKEVFHDPGIRIIIAGKSPSHHLKTVAGNNPCCSLIADPDNSQMEQLIRNAHLHILPSFNNTGTKLKLLNALYNGRHCIINDQAAEDGVTAHLCHIANTAKELQVGIKKLFQIQFTQANIQERQSELQGVYDNERNAEKLMTLIW